MKVIHYINSIDKTAGGTAKFLQLLSNQIKDNINLSIATRFSNDELNIPEIDIKRFNLSISRWFKLRSEFKVYLKEQNPDLVHINGIWTPQNYLFQMEAQRLGIKVLLSPHGMLEPYILKRNWIKKKVALLLYQRKAIQQVDYFHSTADSELSQIRNLGYKQATAVIPNGIDLAEITETKRNFEEKERHFVFLSRIHPKKGIEILIDAVEKIENKNFRIFIAGDGEKKYIDLLKKYSEQKGVSDYFIFKGPLYGNKKIEFFESADIFVLPTHSENFGIVVTEALAFKVPVITTKGTPWEILENEKCGWWIELTTENLRQALLDAINKSPEELKLMGKRGRRLVEDLYDIKIVTQNMLSFYSWIIHEDSLRPNFIDF